MAHEVDAFEGEDEASRVMAEAFVRLPSHARLYPSTVVPALRAALEAAGLLREPVVVQPEPEPGTFAYVIRQAVEAYRRGTQEAEAAIDWYNPFREAQRLQDEALREQSRKVMEKALSEDTSQVSQSFRMSKREPGS